MKDIYVVVAKNNLIDPIHGKDENGEIIFETYTKDATLEKAKEKIKILNNRYGKCRIAKVIFLD